MLVGWKQLLQPPPHITTPGCIVVRAGTFAVVDIIFLFGKQILHLAVVFEKEVERPHIHPDLQVICLAMPYKVHDTELTAWVGEGACL